MQRKSNPVQCLTLREKEVLFELRKGMQYKEMAVSLGIKTDTIKKHTKNIYKKLVVRNRVEAINRAYPAGTEKREYN